MEVLGQIVAAVLNFFNKETSSSSGLINLSGGLSLLVLLVYGILKQDTIFGQLLLKLEPDVAIIINAFFIILGIGSLIGYFYFCLRSLDSFAVISMGEKTVPLKVPNKNCAFPI